ncbi:MAG: hypothetical protein R2828_14715 [Saprospiraceae bacterium]
MINYPPVNQRSFSLFCSPFREQLDANNGGSGSLGSLAYRK